MMPAKRILSAALALLLIAAIPARADGVPTWTLVDRIPGSAGSYTSSAGALGDYLYFASSDDGTNGYELWRTDGTALGTTLVKDINLGSSSSYPSAFTPFGDYLYFEADDGTNGYELWRTNGTTTELVQDINTGADNSSPSNFTAFDGYLYFSADDGTHGRELWRTDGTDAGTTLVKDINLGSSSSYPSAFTPFGDYLYFRPPTAPTAPSSGARMAQTQGRRWSRTSTRVRATLTQVLCRSWAPICTSVHPMSVRVGSSGALTARRRARSYSTISVQVIPMSTV
jgi:ELWxxDGT repeat protein